MKVTLPMVIKQYAKRCKGFLKRNICPFKSTQDTIITYKSRWFIVNGGDILPGPIIVPTEDTLHCHVYNTERGQFLATCTKTRFFFFIPYTYDEFIIQVTDKSSLYNIDTIKPEDFVEEIDEAHNWNKTGRRRYIEGYDYVCFCDEKGSVIDEEPYEIGNNDYKYMKYSNIE